MPQGLRLEDEKIQKLVEKYGTPLQIYDKKLIIDNINRLKNPCSYVNFKHFFAVKALPNPHMLKIMLENGFGLDCSSPVELEIAKRLEVDGEDIMYSCNFTSV